MSGWTGGEGGPSRARFAEGGEDDTAARAAAAAESPPAAAGGGEVAAAPPAWRASPAASAPRLEPTAHTLCGCVPIAIVPSGDKAEGKVEVVATAEEGVEAVTAAVAAAAEPGGGGNNSSCCCSCSGMLLSKCSSNMEVMPATMPSSPSCFSISSYHSRRRSLLGTRWDSGWQGKM